MDCEKFDQVVLDMLYGELDELTAASAKRHSEHCTRCRAIVAELRATREVGGMPLVDPPDGLELRILQAERHARADLPVRQRLGRAVSVLAGYAMRPQLAMAALLLLLISGSLMVLRTRPGHRESVLVTERGVPENDTESLSVPLPERGDREAYADESDSKGRAAASAPLAAAPAPAATSTSDRAELEGEDPYQSALGMFGQGRYSEARRSFDGIAARGADHAAEAALYSARSVERVDGCVSAAPIFDQVAARYPGTPTALEALWQAADCYRSTGEIEKARQSYQALLGTSYAGKARTALSYLDNTGEALAARRAKAKSAPAGAGVAESTNAAPGDKASTKAAAPAKATDAF